MYEKSISIVRQKRQEISFYLSHLNLKFELADIITVSIIRLLLFFRINTFPSLSLLFLFFFLFKLTAPKQEKHGSNAAACEKLVPRNRVGEAQAS